MFFLKNPALGTLLQHQRMDKPKDQREKEEKEVDGLTLKVGMCPETGLVTGSLLAAAWRSPGDQCCSD